MLSGKTGFTGKAGYCYVGALTKGEKSFTIALLACGWPNNRTWKWHDARLLLEYGLEAFDQRSLQQPDLPKTLLVENGQLAKVSLNCPKKEIRMLLSRGDQTDVRVSLPGQLTAPVEAGEQVGTVSYLVNGALYEQLPGYSGIWGTENHLLLLLEKTSCPGVVVKTAVKEKQFKNK